jgi:hypothetical protein
MDTNENNNEIFVEDNSYLLEEMEYTYIEQDNCGTYVHNFGDEKFCLLKDDKQSFINTVEIIQDQSVNAINKVIQYLYFNPRFPENHTFKFSIINKENVFVRTDFRWVKCSYEYILSHILYNVSKFYLLFFTSIKDNIPIYFTLTYVTHISNILLKFFDYTSIEIEDFKFSLIETDIFRLTETDIFKQFAKSPILIEDTIFQDSDHFTNLLHHSHFSICL